MEMRENKGKQSIWRGWLSFTQNHLVAPSIDLIVVNLHLPLITHRLLTKSNSFLMGYGRTASSLMNYFREQRGNSIFKFRETKRKLVKQT
ncbi:hypothetical protein QVD17_37608 [Tagetes erecta]|uniref:Uncharacterized protein n=1 Tax=Tagetes erecta TaxID=13708 RepID=A0AAD8NII2_TARER|nr:hypothetical protein QVD17_37608 [Tagetes erecta]